MKYLSRSDEIILIAVYRLADNAYGVSIVKEVAKYTEKKLSLGGLWVSLDNLAKRGLVEKKLTDPVPVRGGKSKLYYSLTAKGLELLQQTRSLQDSLWRDMPGILGEGGGRA